MVSHRSQTPSNRHLITQLSAKLESNLRAYATAAGAAGVAVLTLASASQAEIVYTPAAIHLYPRTVLDLNGDGITDFTFAGFRSYRIGANIPNTSVQVIYAVVSVLGNGSANQAVGTNAYASALVDGAQIGSAGPFLGGQRMLQASEAERDSFGRGPWDGKKHHGVLGRYLGFRFTIGSEVHYGWARIDIKILHLCKIRAEITGYAYETMANTPIVAGQTSDTSSLPRAQSNSQAVLPTLGLLAQGSRSLSAWRREEAN